MAFYEYIGIYTKICSADYLSNLFLSSLKEKIIMVSCLESILHWYSLSKHPYNLFHNIILIVRHYSSCIKSLSPRLRTIYHKQSLITCIHLFIFIFYIVCIAQGVSSFTNILIKQVNRWRLSMLFKYSVVPEHKIFFCFNKNFLGIPQN